MEEPTETKICSNWYILFLSYFSDVAIDESKFMLHEAYCLRNMTKCKECGEVIEKSELEEHMEEEHTSEECPMCHQEIPTS